MKIIIPPNVKSNFAGYKFFIELYYKIHLSEDLEFIISFENVRVFEANLAAILRAINDTGREKNKNIKLININDEIKDIFVLNNFIEDTRGILSPDNKGTVIPFMKFTPYKDIEFMDYVATEMLSKPDFPKHTKMLSKKINTSIFELFENARTHGNCKYIYTCGQIIKDEDSTRLDFTIVDMGQTIKTNVNKYLKVDFSGSQTIDWAMKSGNTTKTGSVSGGLGLDIIFEFIQLNNGRIQIVSSDGYWEYFKNRKVKKEFAKPFLGTIANIEVNLDDKSRYKLKEEISLKDIF